MISAVIGVPDRLFLNTSIKKGEEKDLNIEKDLQQLKHI